MKATLEFEMPGDQDRFEGAVAGPEALRTLKALRDWLEEQLRPEAERLDHERSSFRECLEILNEISKGAEE